VVQDQNERRLAYIRRVLVADFLRGRIRFAIYTDRIDYHLCTVTTIAAVITEEARGQPYEAAVFIDGLSRAEERRIGAGLHKGGIRVKKVRGIVDEADAMIRLADAVAGFVRNVLEGDVEYRTIYELGLRTGTICELK